ncbi:hypothetical protein B0H12DRAFT_1230387 [Mycena haematopus]|nr:hypothetical protein B0H12DRAFT_1230387 [Mycena haematopus]
MDSPSYSPDSPPLREVPAAFSPPIDSPSDSPDSTPPQCEVPSVKPPPAMTTPLSRDDSPDSPPPLREASPSLWTRSRSTNVIHSCSHSISPAGTARNDRRVGGSTYPSSPPPQRASPPAMVAMDSELHARAPSSRLKRSPTPAHASAQFRAKGKQLPYPILKCCRLPPTAAFTDAHRRCVGILAPDHFGTTADPIT